MCAIIFKLFERKENRLTISLINENRKYLTNSCFI